MQRLFPSVEKEWKGLHPLPQSIPAPLPAAGWKTGTSRHPETAGRLKRDGMSAFQGQRVT